MAFPPIQALPWSISSTAPSGARRSGMASAPYCSHVLLIGAINGPVKWAALACAEIFVLPSKQENFAISIAEAMHIGIPVVITSKVDSWPLVAEAKAGVVLDDATVESSLGMASTRCSMLPKPPIAWASAAKTSRKCI